MSTKTSGSYVGKPEVTASGVTRKGTPPPKKPEVKVKKPKYMTVKSWLKVFVAGVILTDMTWGMIGIHSGLSDPTEVPMMINAMWMFGATHAVALIVVSLVKLE